MLSIRASSKRYFKYFLTPLEKTVEPHANVTQSLEKLRSKDEESDFSNLPPFSSWIEVTKNQEVDPVHKMVDTKRKETSHTKIKINTTKPSYEALQGILSY